MIEPWLISYYGAQQVLDPPLAKLGSSEEVLVYFELARRIGTENFIVDYRPGDIQFTPEREERSAEFLIPSLDLLILVNSTFTHPSLEEDRQATQLFEMLGFRVEFVWDYEIVPPADIRARFDRIPGLLFFGENRSQPGQGFHLNIFAQPRRDITFSNFALPGAGKGAGKKIAGF